MSDDPDPRDDPAEPGRQMDELLAGHRRRMVLVAGLAALALIVGLVAGALGGS